MSATVSVFGGVPSFFRCCCFDASRQRNGLDYSDAGYELARHVLSLRLAPYDSTIEGWADQVSLLESMLDSEVLSPDDVLAWFLERYPKCMAFVPARRRHRFVEGVYAFWLADR